LVIEFYQLPLSDQNLASRERMKIVCDIILREINEDYWERFTKEMERDMYGIQRKI